jgi:hypothetical protein
MLNIFLNEISLSLSNQIVKKNELSSLMIFLFITHIHVVRCNLNQWASKQIVLQSILVACIYP